MLLNRVLRLEKRARLEPVCNLQYELFTLAIRKQKVLIAFTRQRLRRSVNAKVFGRNSYSSFNVETRCVFEKTHDCIVAIISRR